MTLKGKARREQKLVRVNKKDGTQWKRCISLCSFLTAFSQLGNLNVAKHQGLS